MQAYQERMKKDIERLQLERGIKKILKVKKDKISGKKIGIKTFYNFTIIRKKHAQKKKKKYAGSTPSWTCLERCFVSTKEIIKLKKRIESLKNEIRKVKKEANKFKRKYLILKGKSEI